MPELITAKDRPTVRGSETTTALAPERGEIFTDGTATAYVRGNDGKIRRINEVQYWQSKGRSPAEFGTSGASMRAIIKDLGLEGKVNEYEIADVSTVLGAEPFEVGGETVDIQSLNPTELITGGGATLAETKKAFSNQIGDYTQEQIQSIFGGRQPNFLGGAPEQFSQVAGASITSPADTALQIGPQGLQKQNRLLGPTEFENLRKEWTAGFNKAGIQDINVINKAIEDSFITRQGGDILLRGGAPSLENVITRTQRRGTSDITQNISTPPTNVPVDSITEDIPSPKGFNNLIQDNQTQTAVNLADTSLSGIEKQILSLREQLRAQTSAEKAKVQGDLEGLQQGLTDLSNLSTSEIIEKQFEKFKIQEKEDALTKIQNEIIAEREALELGLSMEGQRVSPMALIGRKQRALQEQGLARIGALTAQAEVIAGNLDRAMSKADLFTNAINSDRERQISTLQTLIGLKNDKYLQLSNKEEKQLEAQISTLEKEIEKVEENKNFIMGLLTDPDTASAALEAGISFLDTPETASKKLNPILVKQQKEKTAAKLASENPSNKLLTLDEAEEYGVPYGTTYGELQGRILNKTASSDDRFKDSQYKAAGFAVRTKQSGSIIESLEGQFMSMNPIKFLAMIKLPEFSKPENLKLLEQAQRNFINAVLRRESGAAISPEEFDSARIQYFVQPGDTQAVINQKKQNRNSVIQNLVSEAGGAYTEPPKDYSALTSGLPSINTSYNSVNELVADLPQYQPLVETMIREDNLSDQEILELLTSGFSQDLNTSQKGLSNKIAEAIGQFESGGNYQARGPVVSKGRYKGERAMGKYQIMPGNLPQWSREAVGRVVSEKEFMQNPGLQEQIAKYQLNKIYNQYGNIEDVASVWFSGQPLAKARGRQDDLGTSVEQYAKNVRGIFDKLV